MEKLNNTNLMTCEGGSFLLLSYKLGNIAGQLTKQLIWQVFND